MKRWIVSDTHFYHENIAYYCNRPMNHTELLIQHLVTYCKREDVVYHLGDVHFGTEAQLKSIMAAIPARVYLLRGNHDRWTDTKYLLCGFAGVFDSLVVGNAYLTHIPSALPEGMVNIHGHLHNLGYEGELSFGEGYGRFQDKQHILYAPELCDYRPVEMSSLIAKGGCKNAVQPLHLSRRKRVRDQGLYEWVPNQGELPSWQMPFFTHFEGSIGAADMDGRSFYNPALERNKGELPQDYRGIRHQPGTEDLGDIRNCGA